MSAALLAACGGGSDEPTREGDGLLNTPADSTKQGVKGGRVAYFEPVEPVNFDPLDSSNQFVFRHAHHAYQRLVRLGGGTFADPATGDPEPDDAATAWELSPDKLQITMRFRPDNKLDP